MLRTDTHGNTIKNITANKNLITTLNERRRLETQSVTCRSGMRNGYVKIEAEQGENRAIWALYGVA